MRAEIKGRKKCGPKRKRSKPGLMSSPPKRRRKVLRAVAASEKPGGDSNDIAEPEIDKKSRRRPAATAKPKAKATAAKAKAKATPKAKVKAETTSGKRKAKAADDSDTKPTKKDKKVKVDATLGVPLAKGAHKVSPKKAAILEPPKLDLFEALSYYFDAPDVGHLKGFIVDFGSKWGSKDGPSFKVDMKADLDPLEMCTYNMYWKKPATGVIMKVNDKEKEMAAFSAPASRSGGLPWATKMAVTAKTASLFGYYAEWLLYDGYVDEDSIEKGTSKDLDIMRNVLKSAMEDALKRLDK